MCIDKKKGERREKGVGKEGKLRGRKREGEKREGEREKGRGRERRRKLEGGEEGGSLATM